MALNKIIGGKPSLKRLQKEAAAKEAALRQANLTAQNTKQVQTEKLTFTKVWGRLLIELRAGKYRALYGEASLVETGELEGDNLTIITPKYSVQVLNDENNKQTLENTILNLFGVHLNVKAIEKPEKIDQNIGKLKKLFGKNLKIEE